MRKEKPANKEIEKMLSRKYNIDTKKLKVGVMKHVGDSLYALKIDDHTVELWSKDVIFHF